MTSNSCPVPRNWSHAHNNAIMCYRMYYRGDAMDPSFPAPNLPKDIYVAAEKPSSIASSPPSPAAAQPHAVASLTAITSGTKPKKNPQAVRDANKKKGVTLEDRRLMLKEVKEHLNLLLKEFEGVIPAEDLVRRKRELFLARLPAPPPAKRPKKEETVCQSSRRFVLLRSEPFVKCGALDLRA